MFRVGKEIAVHQEYVTANYARCGFAQRSSVSATACLQLCANALAIYELDKGLQARTKIHKHARHLVCRLLALVHNLTGVW